MKPTLGQRQLGLTIRHRHRRWLQQYPQGFWQPWHMSLLGHGPRPSEQPTTHMDSLYRTNTQQTPAARDLLSFEARTPLGFLPAQTGTTETLLLRFARELAATTDPAPFWTSLEAHYDKHVLRGESAPFLRAASRACMRHLTRTTGQSAAALASSDPGEVNCPEEYGLLARLITLIALSAERPFLLSLYCPFGDYEPVHGLAVNIQVSQRFLAEYGVQSDREVLVGITLAGQDHVAGPHGGVHVPRLVPEQNFSTLFAPTLREGSRMYGHGRSCHLIL